MSRIMRYQLGWVGLARDPAKHFTRYSDGNVIERWVRVFWRLWVRVK